MDFSFRLVNIYFVCLTIYQIINFCQYSCLHCIYRRKKTASTKI